MRRRQFGTWLLAAGVGMVRAFAATADAATQSIKGKLIQHGDAPVILRNEDGREIALSGDDGTDKVLHDPRLANLTLEATGHFTDPTHFAVGPLYEKNMFVVKDGKRLRITYWCDICAIRTYAPGNCVCCQKWTDLDLRDPNRE
jgi:hypothetical protein